MSDVFVISDLHIGDRGPRDNFELGGRTRLLHAFVDHVGAEGGELFVLGDLFELWQMNLSRLFLQRRPLIEHLLAVPLVYVPGNHDVDLVHFIGAQFVEHPLFGRMRLPFERTLGGRRFRFFHGHETDPFNDAEAPGFGRMLAIFAGLFEDRIGSPILGSGESVETVLEQFGESMLALWTVAAASMGGPGGEAVMTPTEALTPAQSPHRLAEHITGVRADRERRGYDVAVLGHTHAAGYIGDWYVNGGSWTGGRNGFLRIGEDGHVRHFEWKDGQAIEIQPVALVAGDERRHVNPFRAAAESVKALFPPPALTERSRWPRVMQGGIRFALGAATLRVARTKGRAEALRFLVTTYAFVLALDGAFVLLSSRREPTTRRLVERVRASSSLLFGLAVLRRADTPEVVVLLTGLQAVIGGALRLAAASLFRGLVDARWLRIAGSLSVASGLGLLTIRRAGEWVTSVIAGHLCVDGVVETFGAIFGRRFVAARYRLWRPRRRWTGAVLGT